MNFIIQLIVGVVLSLASTLLQQAFGSKHDKRTGTRGSAQIGGKVPQYFLVGTVGEAGKLEYQNAWGDSGGVPNAHLTSVTSFGDLPVSALVGLYVNGVRVTLAPTGAMAQGFPVPEYSSHLWWKFFDGAQTIADSYLVSKFGGDADRAWASDMVGHGVPYLITTALWSETLWTGFPAFVGEFQGIKLYDPRKDSAAGGSGPQRWDNPATWAFSDNSAVIIYNIERGIYYEGRHVWGGKKSAAELPYAVWAAAMDACDLPISLKGGGTEKQFRAGRRISLNERPADVIKELLIGANARISHTSDGMVYILVGVPAVADGAFTDADVLASEPLGSIPFPNLDSIINGATATYREPAQAWEDKETAPYYRSDLEAEDDGRQQVEGLDLGTTFSGTQAQRVIKAVIEEGRRFKTHVVALPPEFAQFRPLQVLAWTSDRFDYSAKLFLITARTRDPWGKVVFGLQEIDPADHNWTPSTDERALSFAPVVTNRPPPQEVSGFFAEPATALDSQGRPRRPAIDVFWSAPSVTVDVDFVRISHRVAGESVERWVGLIPRPQLLLGSARIVEALLNDEDFEVQIQYLPRAGRVTVASSWLPVRTRDIRLTELDLQIDGLAAEITEQVAELDEWTRHNTRETIEEKRKAILLNVKGAVGDYNDRQLLRREASSQSLANKAQWSEDILVATGPGSAIVTRIEELRAEVFDPVLGLPATATAVNFLSTEVHHPDTGLEAIGNSILSLTSTVGDVSAGGLLRVYTQAAPSGASARIALSVSATAGGGPSAAAMYLDAMSDGKSRILMVADQISFTNGSALENPFVFEDGVLTMRATRVQEITAGVLRSADGNAYFNLNTKDLYIE